MSQGLHSNGVVARMLVIALVPALLTAVALATWFGAVLSRDAKDALNNEGRALAQHLAKASEHLVYVNDIKSLEELADATLREANVAAAAIRDRSGRTVVSRGRARPGVDDMCDPVRDAYCFLAPIQGSDSLARIFPDARLGAGKANKIGEVRVQMQYKPWTSRDTYLWTWVAALITACLLLAVLVARKLGGQISGSISRLARAVDSIGKGDFNARVPVASGGELSSLEAGINDMAEKFKQGQQSLAHRIEEATRLLMAQKEEAERANLAKSRFLAAATHDLRQPMHALTLFVSALKERIHYPEVSRIVQQIESSVTSMQGMFNALLDISRLDAGVLQAHPKDFYLQALFNRIESDFAPFAQEKGLQLAIVPTRAIVRTDPVLLERILMNLVSNGIRYTGTGGVVLGCRRSKGGLRIEVWDTGAGIPHGRQQDIFHEFVQLNNPERDRNKGLGLGLAIVDRMAKLLGSAVELKSREDKGSVFSIKVARGNAKRVVEDIAPAIPTRRQRLQGALVVFVDDEASILEGMEVLLRDWGCQPIIAASAVGALAALAQAGRGPDIIISDYRLRDLETGIQVINQIREQYGADIPSVLVSGDTAPELLRAAKERGLQILHKPVRPAKLRSLIDHLINRQARSY